MKSFYSRDIDYRYLLYNGVAAKSKAEDIYFFSVAWSYDI